MAINIYVASSWRNLKYNDIVSKLKDEKYEVYDFRERGFSWSEIDSNWQNWTPEEYKNALEHTHAQEGFNRDMKALASCDVCVMIQPCGRSAALELGWAVGAGKITAVLLDDQEAELMLKMVDYICTDINQLLESLREINTYF